MWDEEKMGGFFAIVDGDPRCEDCKKNKRMWLPKYKNGTTQK